MNSYPYAKNAADSGLSVRAFMTVYHRILDKELDICESHEFPEIVFAESGMAPLLIDGKPVTLVGGQMYIYAPGTVHGGAGRLHAVLDNIGFETESALPAILYNRVITLPAKLCRQLTEIAAAGAPLFRLTRPEEHRNGMILRPEARAADVQRLKNQLELFLLELADLEGPACTPALTPAGKPSHRDEFLVLLSYIDMHIGERLTLEHLASQGHISVSKLKLLFHEQTGGGVTECITARRIEAAKELITAGQLTFTQIAGRLGFGSLHYFSRVFSKQTGMSPSDYRRLHNS